LCCVELQVIEQRESDFFSTIKSMESAGNLEQEHTTHATTCSHTFCVVR
jgi:hypothetical protein